MSDNSPKVSIIIPVYNLERYIGKCLDSVFNQTLQDIEVICIDDASTDNTFKILQEYAQKDDRLSALTVEKSGQGINRNRGIERARGAYIGFVDGDDTVKPNMFEKLYRAASGSQSEIAFCNSASFNEEGYKVTYPYFDKQQKRFKGVKTDVVLSRPEIVKHLTVITVVCWNKIYKRSFLMERDIRFNSGIVHEDIPFYYSAMLKADQVVLVNEQLYNYSFYRIGSTTQAAMSMDTQIIDAFKVTEKDISRQLKDEAIARKFFEFKVSQLLSFLSYSFNRQELSRFTQLRFFCAVKIEFDKMPVRYLSDLSYYDRYHINAIKNRRVKLFQTRPFIDTAAFHTQDLKRFKKFTKLLSFISKVIFLKVYYKFVPYKK